MSAMLTIAEFTVLPFDRPLFLYVSKKNFLLRKISWFRTFALFSELLNP